MTAVTLDTFTRAYIEAMLWSSYDESDERGGNPMDSNYSEDDIAPEALEAIIADCRRFQEENAADIATWDHPRYTAEEHAGHDFWLTRAHHGCGFWDGDWAEDVGERLTAAAHKFREVTPYVGDDGRIYLM